jgi:O-antigen/teichoic acid export membrane protein
MHGFLRRILQARTGLFAVILTAGSNVGIQAANVLAGILVARSLGPGGRGSLTAITMWPQFLAFSLTLGVPVASVYSMKMHPDQASSLSGATSVLSILLGCVATLAGLVIIPFSLHTYSPHIIHMAQIAVLVAPLAAYGSSLGTQVQSAGFFGYYNIFSLLPPISILLALALERVTGTLTVGCAAVAYLLGGTPVMFWNLYWVNKHYRPSFRKLGKASAMLLRYGVRAWGADLLGVFGNQVDRILVVGMLAPEAMGFYVVAQSAAGVLNAIPNAVVPVSLPKGAGSSHEAIVALAGRAGRMTLFVMVAAGIPIFLLGKILIHFFYGSKFDVSVTIFHILLIETILDGLTAVLSQAFLAAGYPGTTTLLEGCGVLSAIPLLLWMIPKWGVNGAAVALTLATSMRLLFILLNFPLRFKVRPPSLLIRRDEIIAVFHRGSAARKPGA